MTPRGNQYYLKAAFLPALDDATIDAALGAHQQGTSPTSGIGFTLLGGAIGDRADDSSAFSHRQATWMCDLLTSWPAGDPESGPHVEWARGLWQRLEPFSLGSYVNHLDADEATTRRGYDDAHRRRLAAVKATYDPENVFRLSPQLGAPQAGTNGT